MKKNLILLTLPLLLAGGLVSCKPTEKGYKAAYDAAVGKREAAQEILPVAQGAIGKMESEDGPQLKSVDGYDVYLLSENLKNYSDEPDVKLKNYNVAVAMFKMPTNAKSLAIDLKKNGYEAMVTQSGEDKFYVILYSEETLEKAVERMKSLTESYSRPYVGLPNSPIIIYSK